MDQLSSAPQINAFRVNVIDEGGTISMLTPPHGLKVLAASIADGATDTGSLLARAHAYDADWAMRTRFDIMRFDEHNVDALDAAARAATEAPDADPAHAAFRVIDGVTRQRSLEPGRLGLVVVNMKERRIIQVQNSYDELRREDRGRVRINGEPVPQIFRYRLPDEWSIVP